MVIHKKFSLLVAITLVTVLGVGCGQGESPAAARASKSNKFSDDPEVKEKKEKAIELLIAKCTECGIEERKARECQPIFEEFLDSVAENIAQEIYGEFPTKAGARMALQKKRADATESLLKEFKGKMLGLRFFTFGINSKEDLMRELAGYDSEIWDFFKDMLPSDDAVRRLIDGFWNEDFMDNFLTACADFIVTGIIKG